MKKRILFVLLCVSVCLQGSSGAVEITLPELINPDSVQIYNDTLLITDNECIMIYRLNDCSLIRKFGKKGEGPGEFKFGAGGVVKLRVQHTNRGLMVNSRSRVTFFDTGGNYVTETSVKAGLHFVEWGDQYAGYSVLNRNQSMVLAVNIYNKNFDFQKEIFSKPYYVQIRGKFNLIRAGSGNKRRAYYLVYKEKLYVEGENRIHVFDHHGREFRVITPAHQRLTITSAQKEEVLGSLKKLFPSPLMQKIIRDHGFFPQRFPVRAFVVADDLIWIPTYNRRGGEALFVVMDLTGKIAASGWFPFHNQTLLIPYPFTIHKGKIYQLYDEDGEDWKLVISPFRKND